MVQPKEKGINHGQHSALRPAHRRWWHAPPRTRSKFPEWSLTLLSPTAFTQSSRKPSSHFLSSYLDSLSHLRQGPHLLCRDSPATVTGLPASTLFSQVSSQHSSQSDPPKLRSDHVNLLLQALQTFLASLRVKVRGQRSPRRPAPWLPSPPLFIPSPAALFRLLSPSSPLPTPRPGNMVGRPGVLCPGRSLCLAQSSPHISKSYFLLPASFSQMLISPKTYSDHPLNILTLDFHSFISSATL